ncbi:hypothetical protein GCM10010433_13590 [Streptomyces pulveraceus]
MLAGWAGDNVSGDGAGNSEHVSTPSKWFIRFIRLMWLIQLIQCVVLVR